MKYDILLETEDKNHPKPKPAEGSEDIPGEYRTSPMSQKELADLYGGDVTQKKIRAMIDLCLKIGVFEYENKDIFLANL